MNSVFLCLITIDIESWKKYEMLNPNSMPNSGNLMSEASVGQNDPATELIENAQSLGRFWRNNLIDLDSESQRT